jgi:hypothetical protein
MKGSDHVVIRVPSTTFSGATGENLVLINHPLCERSFGENLDGLVTGTTSSLSSRRNTLSGTY